MMTSVVFMGTPQFAVPIFQALLQSPAYQVLAAVTQPDRRVGRKHQLRATPVKEAALAAGVPVLTPEKINHSPEMAQIIDLAPDLIITAAFGQFLPTKLLAAAKIAALNVHGSLLPKYRGGAPIQYAVMNGDPETGVSIMYMVKKMDAGDVLAQAAIPITKQDDTGTMFQKLSYLGRDLLMQTLPQVVAGTAHATPQDASQVVFAPNITREQEAIDPTLPADRIDDLVRGLRPAPGGNMVLDGVRTKLYDVTPLAETTTLAPGQIVRIEKHGLVLAAGQGTTYRINRLQPAGKAPMDITAYLNGHQALKEGGQAVAINDN